MAPLDPELLDRLVAQIRAGDAQAFTALVEQTLDEVRCFVAVRASDADMVDEAVQNTYIDCYRNLAVYRPGGSVLAWLKGIAKHRVQRALRERSRWVQVEGDAWTRLVEGGPVEELPDESPKEGMLAALRECLAQLAPSARSLIEDYYRADASLAELSQQHRRSKGSLAVTLCRVRSALRDCLVRKGATP